MATCVQLEVDEEECLDVTVVDDKDDADREQGDKKVSNCLFNTT